MIKNNKYRIRILRFLRPFAEGRCRYVAAMVVLSVIALLVDLLQPQLYKMFINNVVLEGNYYKIIIVCFGYIVLFIVNTGAGYIKYFVQIRFSNKLLLNVKTDILNKLFSLSRTKYDNLDVGDVKMRLEDDTLETEQFVERQSIGLIVAIVSGIVYVIMLIRIDWRLTLFSLVMIPTTIVLDNFLSKREMKLNNGNRENDKNMSGWLHRTMQGWREIKALGIERKQETVYSNYLQNYANYYKKWINYWTTRVLVIPKIRDVLLMQFGLYFLGGVLIMNNSIRIGDLLVFVLYYERLATSIKTLSSSNAELVASIPYIDRMVLSANSTEDIILLGRNNQTVNKQSIECISVKNVSFSYVDNDKMILNNVSMNVRRGDRIALVGRSGCGKTTLLKILAGLLEPKQGMVLYNGTNIDALQDDYIYKRVGVIMQDSVLLNCTIRQNLLYGKENATAKELRGACIKANIWNYICSLPNGLETLVGELGDKLSAGQRQRILLARLFLSSPDVYFFDEATSNLDSYNETLVYDALKKIDREKIVFLISHRKSVWKLCNKVYSVEKHRYI